MEENLLGNKLKLEREAKGLSLVKISDELRIPLKFLEKMERSDFSGFPGPTYERAFLRTYAKHLGLNGEEFILLYRKIKGESIATPGIDPEKDKIKDPGIIAPGKTQFFENIKGPKLGLFVGLSVILIFLVFLGLKQCGSRGSDGAQSSVSVNPPMTLTAEVLEDCWFEIKIDSEKEPRKQRLIAGHKEKWEATKIFKLVNVENKDAVKFELDGNPVDFGTINGKSVTNFSLERQGGENAK